MSSKNLARALVLTSSAIALCSTFSDQTAAQSQGDVQIRSASQSAIDSLDSLEQLLLAPPEEANRLNIYVTPQYRRERYESYSENGEIFDGAGNPLGSNFPVEIDSPEFTTDSSGISLGADYLLDGRWLLGGQLSYTKTDFDYNILSEADLINEQAAAAVSGDLFFGDPVDREFDEYGISFSAGYLADPWTALLTVGYSRRNIETETRKVGAYFFSDLSAAELHGVEADFNSDIYSVDLGGSYRWRSGDLSLQPYMSIGYSAEDVEGYTEDFTSLRLRNSTSDQTFFTGDPRLSRFNAAANVDDQTIHSVPGRIGVLLATPIFTETNASEDRPNHWRLRTGLSFTHDFSDQDREIRTTRIVSPFTVTYDEKNRNRNFFSLTAAIGFDFSAVNGSLNYQRDIGLDERKSADILSLQLRVPF